MVAAGVKDRDGDQRGGSEWEQIKILSKEELSLYPKINVLLTLGITHQPKVLETRSRKQPEHSKPSGRSDRPRGAVRLPGSKSQHRLDRSPASVRPVKG